MRSKLLVAAMAVMPADALAFCGVYVGSGETSNEDSQVVVARNGNDTVLTLSNGYSGALAEFGFVVPVPAGLTETSVSVVDQGVIDALDEYTAPRLVRYGCEHVIWTRQDGEWEADLNTGGCMASSGGGYARYDTAGESSDTSTGGRNTLGEVESVEVSVTSRFSVGEYDVSVVDAEGAQGLQVWLDANGFEIPEGGDGLIQEYIDGGQDFLAVRVALDSLPETQDWLSPLQIRYTAETVSLPIRLGTLSSAGTQDMVIYTLGDWSDGRYAISSYPERVPETECLLNPEIFGGAYDAILEETLVPGSGQASWAFEYGWGGGKCDPCPQGGGLDSSVLVALGWQGSQEESFVTRLRMRYAPEDIDRDVVLYPSGITGRSQTRYVAHEREMESFFPICGEGWSENPGNCPAPPEPVWEDTAWEGGEGLWEDSDEESKPLASGLCGCFTGGAAGLHPWAWLILLASVRRRGRS